MDQTGSRIISNALPAREGGGLLARTLAESRSKLQQSPREFVGRITAGLSRRGGESGLDRQSDSARVAEVRTGAAVEIISRPRGWRRAPCIRKSDSSRRSARS